jgi:heme-degrading monooxygenase HmoA
MHARIGRVSFSPDKADEVAQNVKQNVVPRLEQQDGFKGFTLLLDKSGGEGVGISFWESEEALRATDSVADEVRGGVAEAVSGSDEGRTNYEVAFDTMA